MKRAGLLLVIMLAPMSNTPSCGKIVNGSTLPCSAAPHRALHFVGDLCSDAISLQLNLFSASTLKTVTAIIPIYLYARQMDQQVHSNFYDATCHKNMNQFPQKCHDIAKNAVAIPMIGLSSLALFARDEDLRLTGRLLAIGLPFVQSGKDVIKSWRSKCCLRPWNEQFSSKERSSGGFPSGHMANVVYMTALFGMRHGPKWGVPLGLFATFVFADFINCNRHYFSQMVAGAGLGLIYAFAASKIVDQRLSDRWKFDLQPSACGLPAAKLVYRF